jgi:hypothetical protein
MGTFHFLKPADAVAAAQSSAPDYQRITGLKGVDADRIPDMVTRTAAGNARQPEQPWRAHGHLDKFKEIARVEWAKDADPGTAEVFYADGSTDLLKRGDLLCVERPISTATGAAEKQPAEGGPYDGQNFATHSIAVWIISDGTFIEDARNAARAGETELRDHLRPLIFGPMAHRSADDRHTFTVIREGLSDAADGGEPSEGFDKINWEYVRAALLAE